MQIGECDPTIPFVNSFGETASVPQRKTQSGDLKSDVRPISTTTGKRASAASPGRARAPRERDRLLPKRPSAKAVLMQAGELLISRHGFDGVSLREIALFAGQGNNNAVKYYFKNKEGLVHAILDDHMARSDKVRVERFAALKARGKPYSPRDLLAILLLPTLAIDEQVACRFVMQCMLQQDIASYYPLDEYWQTLDKPKARKKDGAVFYEVFGLLREKYKNLPLKVFSRRLEAVTYMFVSCVVAYHTRLHGKEKKSFDAEPILDMALGALGAAPSSERA
jgi:AcrR family transcriptional regulator